MRTFIFLFLVTILAGCAPAKVYFPLNPTNEKEATVEFIRPYIVPTAFALEIFVDGQKAATISNRTAISFSVSAGEHLINLRWPPGSLGVGSLRQNYTFLGGESRHFLINDYSTILGETLVNKDRLYLTELTLAESQREVDKLKPKQKTQ